SLVAVSLDTGRVLEGDLRPSSDTPTHLERYRAFPCGGIAHSHSAYATAFAQARRPVACLGTTHADYFRGDVPVTRPLMREEVEQEYERHTGLVIVETFRTLRLSAEDVPGVLVANHGPLDRKSTRLNSSHGSISYAVFCLKKKRSEYVATPEEARR